MTRDEFNNLWRKTFQSHFPSVANWINNQSDPTAIMNAWYATLSACSLEDADRAIMELHGESATKLLGFQHYASEVRSLCLNYEQAVRPTAPRIGPPKVQPGSITDHAQKVLVAANELRNKLWSDPEWRGLSQGEKMDRSKDYQKQVRRVSCGSASLDDLADNLVTFIVDEGKELKDVQR